MTSRERIITTLEHREPDRVPIDLSGTHNSGIHIDAYTKLKEYLGIKAKKEIPFIDVIQQAVKPDEEVLRRLGVDTRIVHPGGSVKIKEDEGSHFLVDAWGLTWRKPKGGKFYYFELDDHPLEKATIKELEEYNWPDGNHLIDVNRLEKEAKELYENTEYAVIGDAWCGSVFELNWYLVSLERYLMDMYLNPKFITKLIEKTLEVQESIIDTFLRAVGKYIQAIMVGGDIGAQKAPIISPTLYKKFVQPYHKDLYTFIKKRTDAKIILHCCGDVYPFIPYFIEEGVDVLNPVQVSANEMNTKRLKREFGDRLAFWGGGCDTQKVLPFGTPKDVQREVIKRINNLAANGGFVFNQVHNIQAKVPPENIITMFETVKKYGKYPIK